MGMGACLVSDCLSMLQGLETEQDSEDDFLRRHTHRAVDPDSLAESATC